MNRHHPAVEARAMFIYDHMEYDGPGQKPAWHPNGNSTKQDEARREALIQLEAAGIDLSMPRIMRPIPISVAERIAKDYGYDQVVVYGRRVGEEPAPCGEHITTYGINPTHCGIAGRIGKTFQRWMGWVQPDGTGPAERP